MVENFIEIEKIGRGSSLGIILMGGEEREDWGGFIQEKLVGCSFLGQGVSLDVWIKRIRVYYVLDLVFFFNNSVLKE